MSYDPYNPRSLKKSQGDNVAAFPGERKTPPEKARKAAARKATKPAAPDDDAMFGDEETGAATVNGIAAAELRQLVERIERLEEDKAEISADMKEVYAEAKGRGYDTKAMRAIVRLRKKDAAERREEEAILDLYKVALGMA